MLCKLVDIETLGLTVLVALSILTDILHFFKAYIVEAISVLSEEQLQLQTDKYSAIW